MERAVESGSSRRVAWPTLAVLLALAQLDAPARAQETAAAIRSDLAAQKAQMLERLFSSERLLSASGAARQLVEPLVREARARLEASRAALERGAADEAVLLLDEGIRLAAQAVTMVSKQADAGSRSATIASRLRQTESFLIVLEEDRTLSGAKQEEIAELRRRFEAASRQFTSGEVEVSAKALEGVYAATVRTLGEVRRGRTVFIERRFETPRDEYLYERERNESYALLVQSVLAERRGDDPGISELADRLTAESQGIRQLAENQAGEERYAEAIATMERSTERLFAVLRSAGVFALEMQ